MTLGQRIQKARKEAGLSQEELAEQLGVSRQAVSRWENDNGYPEMEKIIRLSQIYQVSLDYLVGNEQEKSGEDISKEGWYGSNELAESFLAHQKSKFMKIGICFLLACVSGGFSYMNMYNNVGNVISTLVIIIAIILIISMGSFVFLIGFLFLPDFYWTVPEDLQYIWYASGDAVSGIGGCFAIYTWGIWRAYRVLTRNEEYWRRKKKK